MVRGTCVVPRRAGSSVLTGRIAGADPRIASTSDEARPLLAREVASGHAAGMIFPRSDRRRPYRAVPVRADDDDTRAVRCVGGVPPRGGRLLVDAWWRKGGRQAVNYQLKEAFGLRQVLERLRAELPEGNVRGGAVFLATRPEFARRSAPARRTRLRRYALPGGRRCRRSGPPQPAALRCECPSGRGDRFPPATDALRAHAGRPRRRGRRLLRRRTRRRNYRPMYRPLDRCSARTPRGGAACDLSGHRRNGRRARAGDGSNPRCP